MTNEEYKKLLDSLDHYYQYTDDRKVWCREHNKWINAQRLAKSDNRLMQIYTAYMLEI